MSYAYDKATNLWTFKDYPYQVTLRFAFKRGGRTPASVGVKTPSKDPVFDQAVQQAMTSLDMPPPPIFGPDALFEVDLPMQFAAESPPDAQKNKRN